MTWTYTADPLNNPVDEVRLLIGDTDSLEPQLQDEELQYFLAKASNVAIKAAIAAVTQLIAKFSRLADETTAEWSVKWSQKSSQYRSLLKDLKDPENALSGSPVAYGGGISITDINTNANTTDRFPDMFTIGMHKNLKDC